MKCFGKVSKLIAILLIGVLVCAGCNNKKGSETDSYLVVNGKKIAMPYVLTIDGEKISPEEYRYFYLSIKQNYEDSANEGENIWKQSPELAEEVKEFTLAELKRRRAVKKSAAEQNISLTSEEISEADTKIAGVIDEYGSKEAYLTALEESFLTEALYKEMYLFSLLENKLFESLYGEKGTQASTNQQVETYITENYINAKHILIKDAEENSAEKKELAEEVLKKVKNGEDFDKLIEEYNEDEGMAQNAQGYHFTKGEMVPEFETAAYALKENETSDIVQSRFGYHIIKRLPLDRDYVTDNFDSLKNAYNNSRYDAMNQKHIDAQDVKFTEEYKLIHVDTLQ